MRAVATGDFAVLRNLRRVCAVGALMEVVIGIDPVRDQTEIARLGLTPLTLEFIDSVLAPNYAAAGFEMIERGILSPSEWSQLDTSWAKRLQGNEQRTLSYLIARSV